MGLSKAELKYLASLQTKKGRRQENRFLVDGVRLLEEALESGYLPLSIMYSPSDLSERGEKLVKAFAEKKIATGSISARECHRLSDTKTSQGIVGLFECKKYSLEEQLDKGYRRILVGDRIADPGNLGTLLRAAVAFDFALVITTAGSAESANPKTVRASMGGFFRTAVVEGVDDAGLAAELKKRGYAIYVADIKGREIGANLKVENKAALIIGSEATGTGEQLSRKADFRIRIPMSSAAESLNSAMAGTVLMFWMNSRERSKS